MIFKDRRDAAFKLIPHLEKYKNDKGVVLVIPRGGVPLGFYVAKHFNFPVDLLMAKKIGHPNNKEFAIGSVSLEGRVLDPHFMVDMDYIESETARIRKTLTERYREFMGHQKPVELKGKTVIIIDDGVATGNTMLASIELIKHKEPAKVIVAVPVAAPTAAAKLKASVNDFICLQVPDDFAAVGQFYADFSEVSDEEVISLLNELSARDAA